MGVAFLGGSTANLPNDFAAAEAAGTPLALTAAFAGAHVVLSIGLLVNAVPRLLGRGWGAPKSAAASSVAA